MKREPQPYTHKEQIFVALSSFMLFWAMYAVHPFLPVSIVFTALGWSLFGVVTDREEP